MGIEYDHVPDVPGVNTWYFDIYTIYGIDLVSDLEALYIHIFFFIVFCYLETQRQ